MKQRFEGVSAQCSGKCRDNKHPYTDADDERKCNKCVPHDPCKNVHKSLEVFAQVHPGVEMRYLFFIAVEH